MRGSSKSLKAKVGLLLGITSAVRYSPTSSIWLPLRTEASAHSPQTVQRGKERRSRTASSKEKGQGVAHVNHHILSSSLCFYTLIYICFYESKRNTYFSTMLINVTELIVLPPETSSQSYMSTLTCYSGARINVMA